MTKRKLTDKQVRKFRDIILSFYKLNGRHALPWRHVKNPYCITVSEIMLQQTQVSRVERRYKRFIARFPDWKALARAPLKNVLEAWQGLGYNRCALYLQKMAKTIVNVYKGEIPLTVDELVLLDGIGKATAGAILAYAHNIPTVFVETNIRRVFIYHFFRNTKNVADSHILPLVKETLCAFNPREWYWAMTDYGAMLPKTVINPNRNSKHYAKQSAFAGSWRQLRAKGIALLLQKRLSAGGLAKLLQRPQHQINQLAAELAKEGFIKKRK